jgi:hypothetical protein
LSVQLAAWFLAASLLNLTRATWDFSYAVLYNINWDPLYTIIPQYVTVVNPILYTWITVVLFGVLVIIGFKKRDGLWSQQQQFYGAGPQQQQFYGVGQGQAFPTPQLSGAGSDKPSVQAGQAELIGSTSPTWRAELTGTNYTNPTQQYYGTQYQQQPPIVRKQVTPTYEVAGTQNERA